MQLYYSKGACSLACRIAINEMALPCEYISVDLKTKRTSDNQDFTQINPKGAVPTLVTDNNEVLTENAVIQQYLADTNHATTLLPKVGDMQRYHVLEWLNYVATEVHKGFSPLFNPEFPQDVKDKIFIPLLLKKFVYVDKSLKGKNFLMGDRFTLPDGYLFVMLTWAKHFNLKLQDLENLTQYYTELKKRDSIAKSLKEEGL